MTYDPSGVTPQHTIRLQELGPIPCTCSHSQYLHCDYIGACTNCTCEKYT